METVVREIIFKNCHLKDLNPLSAGIFTSVPSVPSHDFRVRDHLTLFYVADGRINIRNDKAEHYIHEGQCFLASAGTQTSFHPVKGSASKSLFIEFAGDFQREFRSVFSSPVQDAPKMLFNELINVCENSQQPDTLGFFLASQLFRLYFELSANQTNYSYFVREAKSYIDSRYMEEITIEDISKILNMDRHYISRIFKQEVGESMKAYLLKVRLEKAAALIKNNYNVSQAVQMVGYSDISNFSHKFKEYFGMSPKEYASTKLPVRKTPAESEKKTEIDRYNWSPKNWRYQ